MTTLFINELWTLEPYSTETYKMFPFTDTLISKRAYYALACHYAVQVVTLMVLYAKFDSYRFLFGTWAVLNALEFVEYFFTYNKSIFFLYDFGVNMTNIKFLVLIILSIQQLWKTS